ncbi:MAG: hypothetical protein ACLQVD_06400, partial [Capsulimonadaceae bacterium]
MASTVKAPAKMRLSTPIRITVLVVAITAGLILEMMKPPIRVHPGPPLDIADVKNGASLWGLVLLNAQVNNRNIIRLSDIRYSVDGEPSHFRASVSSSFTPEPSSYISAIAIW